MSQTWKSTEFFLTAMAQLTGSVALMSRLWTDVIVMTGETYVALTTLTLGVFIAGRTKQKEAQLAASREVG